MIRLIKSTFYNEAKTRKELSGFIASAKTLSFNKECEKFEKNFAKWQERKDSVFVTSGSSANLALIQALINLKRIKKGDEVGFSALTWSTNVMPLIQLGLKPVPIDIEADTLNVSSTKLLETLKKSKLKMLFLSNILGFCDDIDKIQKVCKKSNIILIEDNCESFGTEYKGKKLGNFSLASTFSFFVGHHMSTIEGGAVCTNDKELAQMVRIVRAHGWDRNLDKSQQFRLRRDHGVSDFYDQYTFYDLGYNVRPMEVQGFLGNLQIKYADEIVKKREQNFKRLAKVIYKNPNYLPIRHDHIDLVSNFAFPVICRSQKIRDELVKKCKGRVEVRPIVGGDMTQQPFFEKYRGRVQKNADLVHKNGLYFANNPELTQKEIKTLIDIFK